MTVCIYSHHDTAEGVLLKRIGTLLNKKREPHAKKIGAGCAF